jgi:GNAT superfamily N-acetyltransferase
VDKHVVHCLVVERSACANSRVDCGINFRVGPKGVQFIWQEELAHIYLARLFIPEEHRRKGIGRELIRQLKGRARAAGKSIRLTLDAPDEFAARAFYKRMGFHFLADNETMVWKRGTLEPKCIAIRSGSGYD